MKFAEGTCDSSGGALLPEIVAEFRLFVAVEKIRQRYHLPVTVELKRIYPSPMLNPAP